MLSAEALCTRSSFMAVSGGVPDKEEAVIGGFAVLSLQGMMFLQAVDPR